MPRVHREQMAGLIRTGAIRGGPPTVVAMAVLTVMSLPSGSPQPDNGRAALPPELARYSYLTGAVSGSPPGRAVALFQHGFGVELFDLEQAVVLGAGGDVYRRVDVAEDRAGPETQGDPAPMLLSPDGLRVAVGGHDLMAADMAVVELRSGGVTRHPLTGGRSALPMAWSPDGSTLAFLTGAQPTSPHDGSRPRGGDFGLLDVGTGTVTTLPGGSDVVAAAFSPDGTELALQRADEGGRLEVVDRRGNPRRLLDGGGRHLAGSQAWSPDGRLLALDGSADEIAFVDAAGGSGPVPEVMPASGQFLGWSGAARVLVRVDYRPPPLELGKESAVVREVPLDGGAARELTRMENLGSYGVGRLQLAGGLLSDLRVVAPDEVDRGVSPWPFRVAVGLLAGLLAGVAARSVRRRRSRP